VEDAGERGGGKRGGGCHHVALDDAFAVSASNQIDIIAVDDALHRLASVDPGQVRLVELRFFAGLTIDETAEVLGWSSGSGKREWTVARARLQRALSGGAGTRKRGKGRAGKNWSTRSGPRQTMNASVSLNAPQPTIQSWVRKFDRCWQRTRKRMASANPCSPGWQMRFTPTPPRLSHMSVS